MVNFTYPSKEDFKTFVRIISSKKYKIKMYLPSLSEDWYETICECIDYIEGTSVYEKGSVHDISARILYKITKKHELGDGNKRTAVIAVFLFYLLNDYYIRNPSILKTLSRRMARTKGRMNENIVRDRIAPLLESSTELMK